MKDEQISAIVVVILTMADLKVFDFQRIFFGDAPLLFLLEIIFRTFIMYAYTIGMLRLLGKRGMGQLSTLELAIIICFGSAVGDPMMGSEVPIVHGIVAITTVALMQVAFERVINKHKAVENIMEGRADRIISDGVIDVSVLRKNNLSQEDLFRSLRFQQVEHLGQIKQSFFETSGQISVLFHPPEMIRPGLSVMPRAEDPGNGDNIPVKARTAGTYCCLNCGYAASYKAGERFDPCKMCGCANWEKACPARVA